MVGQEGFGRHFVAQFGLFGALLGIEARIAGTVRRHQHAAVSLVGADNMLAAHQVLAGRPGEGFNMGGLLFLTRVVAALAT